MDHEILDETKCELGEGPTYDPAQDKAWWFDIAGKKLFEHDFASARTSGYDLPVMASMLGVVDEATQLVATEDGLYLRDTATNRMTLHHPLEADDTITRSNDGRVHSSGALWIGTMGKAAEPEAGAIYWFRAGELRQLFANVSIPNAICFSPTSDTAYFTDSAKGLLMRVAIDPQTALPTGEPQVLHDHRAAKGAIDGAVVDAHGMIWNAAWGAACLNAFAPEGSLERTIRLPVRQPTCPAFIGRKLDRLLVTSAWQGMSDERRAADVDGGKTLIADLAVEGRAEPRVTP